MDRGAIAARFAPHQALVTTLLNHGIEGPDDGAHDIGHVLRVWANVQTIAAAEGGDLRILAAATLLHDAVDVPKTSPLRAQASRLAAKAAQDRLLGLEWQAEDIEKVAHAIEAHSFSAEVTPRTAEARVLQDADRLDAIGLIGVARCCAVSGRLGRALYDPQDPMALQRPLDDTAWALDHFETKLLRLAEGFKTDTGRRLAQMRHARCLAFQQGLIAEISGADGTLPAGAAFPLQPPQLSQEDAMSAPDTNVETQKKRHFGPLIGITAGLVFAGILVFAYITSLAQPPGEGQADQVESPSVSVPAEN